MRSYKHIGLDYLYLMAENDMAFVKDIIYSFKEAMPLYFKDLDMAVAKNDLEEIRFFAHKLSSSVQIVGARELSGLARTIENQSIAQANVTDLLETKAKLLDAFNKVVEELNEELNLLHEL